MKKRTLGLTALAAVAAIGGFLAVGRSAKSADHLDSNLAKADPAADINDLYSWVDGNNAVFAVTVSPVATATSKFSNAVQYVIHTNSGATYGNTPSAADIICTFDAAQVAKCWAGADEYVTGNAGAAGGITSASGKFKVFAGLRADPFFFNLKGFQKAVTTVKGAAAGGLGKNAAGCFNVDAPTSAVLVGQLQGDPDGAAGAPGKDFFKALNTLAIVVQIDKSLVTKGGPIVATWASTNKAN
jgi:hypothetical protein